MVPIGPQLVTFSRSINTHRNIVALLGIQFFHGLRMFMAAAAERSFQRSASSSSCALVTTPLFHVSGLYTGAVSCLANGLKSVWTSGRFDPVKTMRLIEREKVTSWGPMGTMAHRVVNHPEIGRYDLSSIQNIGPAGRTARV